MDHIKKHLYWDKYGVKTFPYRGKRKYFPCIYQDYDGTFMIRNDVFGLTIAQFEREFKGCLARRKERESQIQNVRFPDKTSKEYIEYLKCGDNTIQGCIRVRELFDDDRHFRCLVQIAGTECDIRIKQRMFIFIDNIQNISLPFMLKVSSGSLAEGIELPGSDMDTMMVVRDITVIDDIEHLHLSARNTTFLMENDNSHPGFCKLKLVAESFYPHYIVTASIMVETEDGVYLSAERFLRLFRNEFSFSSACTNIHGPCVSDKDQALDIALCLRIKCWPNNAFNWYNRHRKGQWPSFSVIDSVLKEGCHFVPIAPRNSENKLLWRISFSMAEKRLIHSMNYTQLLCYVLLKLTLKNCINRNEEIKELLCSYFLKTTVFWLSEEISINTFNICNLSHCYFLCIDKLVSFVRNCYCPNYFIPRHNMFIGKIDESNSKPLLSILIRLRNTELQVIMDSIFGSNVMYEGIFPFIRIDELSMNLELLFYRVLQFIFCQNVERACTTLQYIKSLMKSESTAFILGVLRYYIALTNQLLPQMLVLPDRRHERFTTIRRYHKYLMEGTKSDAVSGWLLYASFHYVLGDYTKTLQVVDNVLSRCTPDKIWLRQAFYTTEEKNKYKHKTKSHLTLNHKMRQVTIGNVFYTKQSTLIPQELQLEVQDGPLHVPTVVMSQCLRFLCYHHLGDVNNKQRALHDLYLTITERYFVSTSNISKSLVILGVCNEVSGDKDTAYQCYNDALHCDECIWPSAERRWANLF